MAPGPPDPKYRGMANHASYDLIYRDPRLWDWAFAQTNADGAKAAFDTFVSHLEAERDRNSPTAGTLLRLKVPKVREACGG